MWIETPFFLEKSRAVEIGRNPSLFPAMTVLKNHRAPSVTWDEFDACPPGGSPLSIRTFVFDISEWSHETRILGNVGNLSYRVVSYVNISFARLVASSQLPPGASDGSENPAEGVARHIFSQSPLKRKPAFLP